ncbi:MAG: SCP2 sterol-binding domain-containing protein [Thermoanaerobaculaceae bacterium]
MRQTGLLPAQFGGVKICAAVVLRDGSQSQWKESRGKKLWQVHRQKEGWGVMLERVLEPAGVDALAEALAADEELAKLAQGTSLRIAFVLEPEAGGAARALALAISQGSIERPRILEGSPELEADYVLRASGAVWRSLLQGELEPIWAVSTGKLKVAGGDVFALASQLPLLRRFLKVAQNAAAKLA